MTTHADKSPVTRETSAYVRDKGLRAIIVTVSGGLLELRAKGLRSRETLDVGWCYEQAVKHRIASERAERKRARRERR